MTRPELLGPALADPAVLEARFHSAQPFPHVVLDGFLRDGFCRDLLDEFPPFERGNSLDENGQPGWKSVVDDVRAIGPAFRRLDALIADRAFLSWLEAITGIEGLLYDPDYVGGGTHENRPGQDLDAHIDFNCHPRGWHRRLNLLLYLNPVWEEGWGGALELRRSPREPAPGIVPLYNRAVLFETSDHSWHGFDRIRPPDDKMTRRSIALYFYTAAPPATRHTTRYVEAALSDPPTVAELSRLLSRRIAHVERLFVRERGLVAQAGELIAQALGSADPSAARALARAPLELIDQLLDGFYAREVPLRELLARAARLPRIPVDGPLAVRAQDGLWHDGWVAERLEVELEVGAPVAQLALSGWLPPTLAGQTLVVRVGDQAHESRSLPAGEFRVEAPVSIATGSARLIVLATRAWQPCSSGESEDVRPLAWRLHRIDAR